MKSEVMIDLCFIREKRGELKEEVERGVVLAQFQKLKPFLNDKIKILISDDSGEKQAEPVYKTLKKIEPCPDQTHCRLYFDDYFFLAIPVRAELQYDHDDDFHVYDREGQLHYQIRKERTK